ncbi:hypothetical protein WJX72_005440 [[Myrmecia] bisecta]|uniref:Peroxisomal ATPase PEX1 n=1 Tax=[Myrmecia] bisecta TaxID=41462 RepID=A0AAW1R745_9CHLO
MEFFDAVIVSEEAARLSQLVVRLSAEKSCWVALPATLIARLYDAQLTLPLVLELQLAPAPGAARRAGSAAPVWHVAWAGAASGSGGLDIPAALAGCLGIPDGSLVQVKAVPHVPPAVGVSVEPVSVDDWEVVELHAEYMEEQLLNQVGAVRAGQPFPFWVKNQSALYLRVATAIPADLVRLVQGAEVAIAPRTRARPGEKGVAGSIDSQTAVPATAGPTASLPAVWLRVLAADDGMAVPLHAAPLAPKAATLDSGLARLQQWRTWQSTVACVSAATARLGHLAHGQLVSLSQAASRSPKTISAVPVEGSWMSADDDERPAQAAGTAECQQTLLQNGTIVSFTSEDLQQVISFAVGLAHKPSVPGASAPTDVALPALERLFSSLAQTARTSIYQLGSCAPGGLLICGTSGSGKTGLARLLAGQLEAHPACLAHVVHVDCGSLATESADAIKRQLSPLVQEALDCMPSLLILDDLQLICAADQDGPEAGGSGDAAGVADWLADVLDSFASPGHLPFPVAVCATCNDAAELAAPLRAAGRLDCTLRLPTPGTTERASILQTGLVQRGVNFQPHNLQALASKADGYDSNDLRVLLDRAVHAAVRRQLADPTSLFGQIRKGVATAKLTVTGADLATAQTGFSPAASWGVGQGTASGAGPRGWQDVGGMADVKAALREALEVPTRFAHLMAKAPLRLRTGVLLYGPPGCGKTHAVAAAVAAAGVRLVSVKGPEVLNKYIGASEAAVRDLFRRASAAAPCVLFFDEFDAIAPQRGHDSTGVTDRVVNQLLTELDGVEGLTGVCVIAATSRPDLLDAALLRPGRLDRLIYCGFPRAPDRVHIMRALAHRLRPAAPGAPADGSDNNNADQTAWQAELRKVATAADGFTGADLSALLSEAQLAAVHQALDTPDLEARPVGAGGTATPGAPVVSAEHVRGAAGKARPSVPPVEKARLEAIYARFRESRDPGIGNVSAKGKGKRATLA